MHIYAFHVRNFRRFQTLTIHPNEGLNVIVGANNSGKSALLRALDLALNPLHHPYREDLVGRFDFNRVNLGSPIEVWVYFHIPKDDAEEIHDRFGRKTSRWLLQPDRTVLTPSESPTQGDPPFVPAIKEPMVIEANSSEKHVELLATRFMATWNEEKQAPELSWAIIDETGERTSFSAEDRAAIGFNLIPVQRDPLQMLGFTRRSLTGRELDDTTISRPLRGIVRDIEKLKESLLTVPAVGKRLRQIENTLNDLRLLDETGKSSATVTFLRMEVNRLRGAIELAFAPPAEANNSQVHEASASMEKNPRTADEFYVPLSYQGDGVQNALLLGLLVPGEEEGKPEDSASKTGRPAKRESIKTVGGQRISAIEEPERSLEPWRVRSLFSRLEQKSTRNQIFISTHSPVALGEVGGAESLIILAPDAADTETTIASTRVRVIEGTNLSKEAKKEFEHCHEPYGRCLFARLVLIVEGCTEMGFLPIALLNAAKKRGGPDLMTLGLELLENYEGRKNPHTRAERLKDYGKRVAVLLDHDEDERITTDILIRGCIPTAEAVFVWSKDRILRGAKGCDLEVAIAEGAPLPSLTEAVKTAYADPGHSIDSNDWTKARGKLDLSDSDAQTVPKTYPDPATFCFADLGGNVARLALLALMHGPHSIKSAWDMRQFADKLGTDGLPEAVLRLYDRLKELLESPERRYCGQYYDLYKGKAERLP